MLILLLALSTTVRLSYMYFVLFFQCYIHQKKNSKTLPVTAVVLCSRKEVNTYLLCLLLVVIDAKCLLCLLLYSLALNVEVFTIAKVQVE